MIKQRQQRLILFSLCTLVIGLQSMQAVSITINAGDFGEFDQEGVDVDKTTIIQLKKIVQGQTGVSSELQRIILGGKELGDNNTLQQEGINSDTKVSIIFKLVPITVQLEDGKEIKLKLAVNSKVEREDCAKNGKKRRSNPQSK
ncbi:MAG: ubiquitin-like domain-containing protein [Bacteroidota bacterium]